MNGTNPDDRRVALLSTHYWPEVRRGTERLVHDLAAELATGAYSPRVIAGCRASSSRRLSDGFEVQLVRAFPRGPLPHFGYTEPLGHLLPMGRALRGADAQVVHSFGFYEAALAMSPRLRGRGSTVLTVTGIPQRAVWEGLLWRRRAVARAARSDAIIAISEAARRTLDWLGGEVRVIHPGVDLTSFRRQGEPAKRPTLFCNAAIDDPRKRVGLVVEAFRELRSKIPELRLVLSSRGDRAPGPEDPGIEYRNLDAHSSLVEAYSEAWASVLVSRDEAFGLAAVESLACGTPVLASSDAGLLEAVGEGTHAVLFDGDSPSKLASAMSDALDRAGDPEVELASRQQAERFSIERCAAAHVALYDEVCSRR